MKVNFLPSFSMNSIATTFRSSTPLQKSVSVLAVASFALLAAYLVSKLYNYYVRLPQRFSPLNAGEEQTIPNIENSEKEKDQLNIENESCVAKTEKSPSEQDESVVGKSDEVDKDSDANPLSEKPTEEQLKPISEVESNPGTVVNDQLNGNGEIQSKDAQIQKGTVNAEISEVKEVQVFVKMIHGMTRTFSISLDETVQQLKKKIEERTGIPIYQQRMIFAGKQLEDGMTLNDYRIFKESTIHLVTRLQGD